MVEIVGDLRYRNPKSLKNFKSHINYYVASKSKII